MARYKRKDAVTKKGKDVPQQILQGIRETNLVNELGNQAGLSTTPIFTTQDNDLFIEILEKLDILIRHMECVTGENFNESNYNNER